MCCWRRWLITVPVFLSFWKSALIIINVFLHCSHNSLTWEFVKYSTTGYIPTVHYHFESTTCRDISYNFRFSPYGRGTFHTRWCWRKDQEKKKGGRVSWCKKKGICRKVEDRSYVTWIRVILLSPSTPIHPLRWCMKIHLCYKLGAKTTQRKSERDTKDGLKDRCIYAGRVWPKPDHWESQISQQDSTIHFQVLKSETLSDALDFQTVAVMGRTCLMNRCVASPAVA